MPKARKLLYPFTLLYKSITSVRNYLYDVDILESSEYDFPVIAVGNLNTGGTGKSPMVEYLLKFLRKEHKVASLSRGYKRRTRGFRLVNIDDLAEDVGDEPLQFKSKFPDVIVAVDADRRNGIAQLAKDHPDLVVLDDAFQHRKVTAGLYILLTAFGDLYIDDLVLPAGNLRESVAGAARADVIVITKCPKELDEQKMEVIAKRLRSLPHQKVFFSTIKYAENIYFGNTSVKLRTIKDENAGLITGIANPKPLLGHLKKMDLTIPHYKYPDHHHFSSKEIATLLNSDKRFITTEKDYMRLKDKFPENRLGYLPIEMEFLDGKEVEFQDVIKKFINKK